MRWNNRYVSASIIFSYIHNITGHRMAVKIGNLFSPSMQDIMELVKHNMEYNKK